MRKSRRIDKPHFHGCMFSVWDTRNIYNRPEDTSHVNMMYPMSHIIKS